MAFDEKESVSEGGKSERLNYFIITDFGIFQSGVDFYLGNVHVKHWMWVNIF